MYNKHQHLIVVLRRNGSRVATHASEGDVTRVIKSRAFSLTFFDTPTIIIS
jgi:hypothetical protein